MSLETSTPAFTSPGKEKKQEYINRIMSGAIDATDISPDNLGSFYTSVRDYFIGQIPTRYRNGSWPPELVTEMWNPAISTDPATAEKQQYVRAIALHCHQLRWNESGSSPAEPESTAETDAAETQAVATSSQEQLSVVLETTMPSPTEKIQPNKTFALERTIERTATQEAFGDSNGSYEGFIAHLKNRDLIDGALNWTGGTTRAIFIGDILGDRSPDGLRIYRTLHALEQKATAAGGSITWLAGNHENMSNAVLGGFTTEFGTDIAADMRSRLQGYAGNLEWGQFLPPAQLDALLQKLRSSQTEISTTIETLLKKKQTTITLLESNPNVLPETVANYRNGTTSLKDTFTRANDILSHQSAATKEDYLTLLPLLPHLPQSIVNRIGDAINQYRNEIKQRVAIEEPMLIDALAAQKIAFMQDDVLYTHTNFTAQMARIIFRTTDTGKTIPEALDQINHYYQSVLRWHITPEPKKPASLTTEQSTYFNQLRDAFLSTAKESRVNYSEQNDIDTAAKERITQKLRTLGVRAIIHGHNDEGGEVLGTADMPIISIDNSTFKEEGSPARKPTSHATIGTDGVIGLHG